MIEMFVHESRRTIQRDLSSAGHSIFFNRPGVDYLAALDLSLPF